MDKALKVLLDSLEAAIVAREQIKACQGNTYSADVSIKLWREEIVKYVKEVARVGR